MRLSVCQLLFLSYLIWIGGAQAQSAEWPRFYGSQVDNKSTETGLLKAWPEGGPKLLFKIEGLGKGYANVTIKGNTFVTAGTIDRQTCVLAYDSEGKLLWKTPNMDSPTAKIHPLHRQKEYFFGVKGTPTIDGNTVYHMNMFGRLAALDLKSGQEKWHVNVAERFQGEPSFFGYAESVVIDGEKLYVQPGGKKGFIVALNKNTGATLWSNTVIQDSVASYATPVLAMIGGKKQLVTMTPFAAVGIDPQNGDLLWKFGHINRDKENIETPVVFDDHVVISSCYGQKMDCFKVVRSGSAWKTEEVWSDRKSDNLHGGLIYCNGYLYGVACRGGRWFCLDAKTGVEQYRDRGVGLGELTYADGHLYCLGHDGTLVLVPAVPTGFVPAGTLAHADDGESKWYTHPVVSNGRLYIRHGNVLYVYNIKA
jgi:outer membrane protein assembly factor BamB